MIYFFLMIYILVGIATSEDILVAFGIFALAMTLLFRKNHE